MNKTLIITSSLKNYNNLLNLIQTEITNDIVSVFVSEKKEFVQSPKTYFILSSPINLFVIDELEKIIEFEKPTIIAATQELDIKNIIARIAVRLKSGVLADINEIKKNGGEVFYLKYAYGGNYIVKLSTKTSPVIITLKPSYYENRVEIFFKDTETKEIIPKETNIIKFIERTPSTNEEVSLENAKKVIGIGRGVKSEDFPLIEKFAKSINAVIGYTRPVIHSGIASYKYQIGITGKIISPQLYIAIGISGKEYHMKGVEKAKKIISINTDPNAEIKKYSDIFINCDYRNFLNKILV
jgi:electron transfer flavoprotein alpha subunit